GSAEVHYEFAVLLIKQGDLRSAYGELVRAIERKPNYYQARYQLATLHLLAKDPQRAKQELEKMRETKRDAWENYHLAAQIAAQEGDINKALENLQKAVEIDPKNAMLYLDLGQVQVVKANLPGAEAAFRKARAALAVLYALEGKQDRAEEELLTATRGDPENEQLLHVLGNFYATSRKLNEYEKIYVDLLKRKPDSLVGRKRLAELYLARGDAKNLQLMADEII